MIQGKGLIGMDSLILLISFCFANLPVRIGMKPLPFLTVAEENSFHVMICMKDGQEEKDIDYLIKDC